MTTIKCFFICFVRNKERLVTHSGSGYILVMAELSPFKYVPTDQEITFAQVVACTGDYARAWTESGYEDKGQAKNYRSGYALSRRDKIVERVAFAKQMLAHKAELRDELVVNGFKSLAFSNMADFIDGDGEIIDLATLSRDQMFAVKSVKVTQTEFGVVREVVLHDKFPNMDRLAKILNLYERNNQASAPKIVLNLGKQEVVNVIEQ